MTGVERNGEHGLERVVGVRALAATTFNVTVGGGIFVLPAVVAASIGAAAPLAYVVCAVAMGLIVLCFAEAGSRVSLTGGPYAYVEVALGPFVGLLAGALLWLVGATATAAVASAFAGSVAVLWAPLGGAIARAVILLVLFVPLAALNIRGVRQGARLIEVATVAKLVPLLLFVVVGLAVARGGSAALGTVAPATLGRSVIVLIFAFAGVESALAPSGEVRDPARTVPRALFIAMTGITLLYVLIQWVAQRVLGAPALARETAAPLAAAAQVIAGAPGATVMLLGAAISMFGYVSGMTLVSPRALYAFGRDGILPPVFARVHARWHTPWVAIAAHAAITFFLGLTSGFARLAILSNVAVLVLYLLCCIAAWRLQRMDVREGGVPFRVPGGALVPVLAVAVIVWILSHATAAEFETVGAVLAAASLLFVLRRGAVRSAARIG